MSEVVINWFRRYFSSAEAIGIVSLLLFSVVILKTMGNVVAPVLASVIIVYMLTVVVKKLESWHCPHLLAVILVFTLFIGTVLLALLWLLPLLWDELSTLFAAVPGMLQRGQKLLLELQQHYPLVAAMVSPDRIQEFISNLGLHFAGLSQLIWNFSLASLNGVMSIVVYLVLVPLLVFFLLKDGAVINNWVASFLPHQRMTLRIIWREINYKIGSYIKGKILEMLIVFLVAAIAFALIGLPYAILLGTLVGLSVLVPYIGVVIVTIPIVIVALLEWGWSSQFLYLMMVYVAIIVIDANILVPMLFAGAMNLHPIAIILAVLIFGSLGGFWGIFFAIPLVALGHVLVEFWPQAKE